jgi:hypothetical protein
LKERFPHFGAKIGSRKSSALRMAAFVPGYDHDVFVSYAHVNNLETRGAQQVLNDQPAGWVDILVRDLEHELSQKIGVLKGLGFEVWFDKEALRGYDILNDKIAAQIKASALFVAVRSPAYHASVWCRDEARLFAEHFAENLADRIFVVEKDPVEPDAERIPGLDGRRDYPFWYRASPTGPPLPLALPMTASEEIEYHRRVRSLAAEIYSRLKAMGGTRYHGQAKARGPLTGALSGGSLPVVFLNAEAHHRDLADEIREGIGDRAIWIEPSLDGSAGQNREEFERTLNDCVAMVTIYTDNPSWARSQLLAAHRLAAQNPARKILVIDAPPREKPRLGIHNLPNMEVIDARQGISTEVLSRLQACLGI